MRKIYLLLLSLILLPYMAGAQGTGVFTVTGGTQETDYSYTAPSEYDPNGGDVLTIKSSTQLTISTNNESGTTGGCRIVINQNVTANITLAGVNITPTDANNNDGYGGIDLGSGATLNITLQSGNSNVIKGGTSTTGSPGPGIHVPEGSTLTIKGEGSLTVEGASGDYAAAVGIGGMGSSSGAGGACGNVIILGGTITVHGGTSTTGSAPVDIGGGATDNGTGGNCSTVIILTSVNSNGNLEIGGGAVAAVGGGKGSDGQGIRPSGDNTYTVWGNLTLPEGVEIPEDAVLTGDGSLTTKLTQSAPNAPTLSTRTSTTVTLSAPSDAISGKTVEYSCVAGNGEASEITDWQSNATFNGLSPQTTYTFYARYAGDDKFYNASPASNGLSVTTLPTAPESSAVTIDYAVETISFDSSTLEMSTSEDFTSGTAISSGGSVEAYMGQTVYVRVKAVNDIPASTPTAITIPARPDAPTLTIDNQTEGVTIPDGYSYNTTSADYSNTWTQCTGALVHIDPSATIYIYKAAVTSGEASAFKSQVQTITAPARSENPTAPTIDYQQETLTTSTTLQCSTDKGTTWTTCTDNMTLAALDWTGGEMDVQFRTAATTGTDGKYASDPVSLTIPSRPAAPTGLTATEETCIDGKDGKITGVTTDMEYKLSTADVWIDCTDIEITGLAPGTYQVRLAATETAFAGEEASVTIEEVVEIQIDKSESSIELGSEGVVLTATITGIDDVNKAENWIWTSSNDKVAEVIRLTPEADVLTTRSTYSPIESTARVTPVGEGTATITVTYTGTKYMATKTYDITVKAKEEEPAPKPDPTPIYYNIQFEDICEGVDASLSKSVVKAGNQVSVYVEVEEGYDGENLKVLFKRSLYGYWKEVEEGVQPGEYIIYNVYDDIYVKVEGVEKIEEDPTGMSDIEGTKVYAQNGSLYVYTSQPQEVMIITMNGTILKRERQEGLQSYSLPKGVYIICIGEQTFKVRN